MIVLTIDGRAVSATEGTKLLAVCLKNGIYVPHLCDLPGDPDPGGACRLCLVEIDDAPRPLCACTVTAAEGMAVSTDAPRVRELQRSALQLLLSAHHIDCAACAANRRCGLQDVARFLGIRLQPDPYPGLVAEGSPDTTHPVFDYLPHRCILCGKCVKTCRNRHAATRLSFAGRGLDTVVTSFGATAASAAACTECQACARVCPVGALVLKDGSRPTASPRMPPE